MTKLQKALSQQKDSTEQVHTFIAGILGIPLNGKRQVEVQGRNGFLYVRLRNNQSEVIQAFNNQVSPAYNLPVLVERQGNRYVVVSVDTQRYGDNWTSYSSYLPRHGNTHSFDLEAGGGGDIVWVQSRQITPLLAMPSGSDGGPNVIINPYTLKNSDGTWKYIGNTGTQNLTTYNPSSPTGAIMALVYADSISGNPYILVGSGTVFSNTITGTSAVAPYIPSVTNPAHIPLAAVRLITGSNALSWNNIYDVRQWLHVTPTGTGGSSGGGSGIDTLGFAGLDEGVPIGTGTFLNVIGQRASFTRSGTMFNLDISPDPTELIGVYAQDEGVPLGTGTTLNFVGDNIHASISGSVVRVFVTGTSIEGIQDIVGAMVTDGVQSGIAVTYDDTLGALDFAVPSVSFSAYRSTNQSINDSTFTKVQFGDEEYDTNGFYDSATNHRFTPTVAGKYLITAAVTFASAGGATFAAAYRNGTRFKDGNTMANTSLGATSTVSAVVEMNGASDYVEIFCYQNSGGSLNVIGTASLTYFQATLQK